MNGMKLEQYNELYQFVLKYNKFGWVKDSIQSEYPNAPRLIKYIDVVFDTRQIDGDIWSITFRYGGDGVRFSTNEKIETPFNNLFDLSMAFLKGEYKPNKKHYIKR